MSVPWDQTLALKFVSPHVKREMSKSQCQSFYTSEIDILNLSLMNIIQKDNSIALEIVVKSTSSKMLVSPLLIFKSLYLHFEDCLV